MPPTLCKASAALAGAWGLLGRRRGVTGMRVQPPSAQSSQGRPPRPLSAGRPRAQVPQGRAPPISARGTPGPRVRRDVPGRASSSQVCTGAGAERRES